MTWWGELIERLRRAGGLSDRYIAKVEKRKALRVKRRLGLHAQRENGEQVPVMVVDCAATGMRVESAIRLKKGEMLRLALTPERHRESTNEDEMPRARVIWIRKHAELLTHRVGLAFLLDTPDQRRGIACFLLDDCKAGIANPKEHRRAPRVSTGLKAKVKVGSGELIAATVKDLAVGGVLLLSPRPITRTTPVEVSVFLDDGRDAPLECTGSVVRALSRGDGFELGIAFTSVPADHRDRLVRKLSKLLQT